MDVPLFKETMLAQARLMTGSGNFIHINVVPIRFECSAEALECVSRIFDAP